MKILDKRVLTDSDGSKVTRFEIFSPDIAKKALPGQFIALMVAEDGERIPLTIVERDLKKGSITIIFQEVGLTTKLLGKMNAGDSLYALVGPLGHATELKNYGNVILVGGGVGIAEIYPVAKGFKEAGNRVFTVIGARNKSLLILEKELKEVSDELFIATDDGSYGRKGFTTDILQDLLSSKLPAPSSHPAPGTSNLEPKTWNLIYAVGPIPMMKRVSAVAAGFSVKSIVSLNALMVDATGMCGCCRVTVAGVTKFSCVDGPEFEGAQVDWDELTKRNRIYEDKEKHVCKLYDTGSRL